MGATEQQSVAELLAIVGGKDTGEALLALGEGSLRRLAMLPAADLQSVPGVGAVGASRIIAAFELGRRRMTEDYPPPLRIRSPADVQRLMGAQLRDLPVEEFHVLALGSQSQVLKQVMVTRGLLNSSLVHPREVFHVAISARAAGIIVVHNHPSGDPTPSADDRSVTHQLVESGRLLDVPVYDHVVLAGERYVSFAEAGLL